MSDTVLITGGCGFIGSHLGSLLVKEGYDVRLFDNLLRGTKSNVADIVDHDAVELIRGDIRNREVVDAAVEGVDYVAHLAATNLNRGIEYPSECLQVNVTGTNNVIQSAIEHDVEKVLFSSSASVYGNQDVPMEETDAVQPQTPYGIAKYTGERLLKFYGDHHDLDYLTLRFFNVYGAGQDTDAYYTSVINVFIKRIARGEPPVIHGSGEQSMDFVNVHDLARALFLGIERDASNEVLNIGSGESTTIAALAKTLIDIMDVDLEPEYEERDVLVSERKASTERASRELGYEPTVSLEEGLSEVVEYVLADMEESTSD